MTVEKELLQLQQTTPNSVDGPWISVDGPWIDVIVAGKVKNGEIVVDVGSINTGQTWHTILAEKNALIEALEQEIKNLLNQATNHLLIGRI